MAILQCIYVMTLTKFMARSTWVAHAFEWEKLLKCHLKGKTRRNWQMDRILIILKKENGPRASSAPALGLNTIIFKHVYWYMQQTQVSVYRTIGPLVVGSVAVVQWAEVTRNRYAVTVIVLNSGVVFLSYMLMVCVLQISF